MNIENNIKSTQQDTPVFISNTDKTLMDMRLQGLTLDDAKRLMDEEIALLAKDYGKLFSAELLELIDPQFISAELERAYFYIDEYKLDWPVYKIILTKLLSQYSLEEFVVNHDLLRCFMVNLYYMTIKQYGAELKESVAERTEVPAEIYETVLHGLEEEDIIQMTTSVLCEKFTDN